jgi:hypothetical protein
MITKRPAVIVTTLTMRPEFPVAASAGAKAPTEVITKRAATAVLTRRAMFFL